MSKQTLSFNVHHNEHEDLGDSLERRYVAENFSFGLSGIEIKDFKKMKKELFKSFEGFKEYEFKIFGGNKFIFENENIFIVVRKYGDDSSFLQFFTKDLSSSENVYKRISKFVDKDKEFIIARNSFFFGTDQQLRTKDDVFKIKDFEDISESYYPGIDLAEFIKQFINSDESILILSGKSGTGKSKFLSYILKFLLDNPKLLKLSISDTDLNAKDYISIAYIKNERVLSSDEFWVQLKERSYDLVILDDLDYFLSPREQSVSSEKEDQKDKFVSELLSFTDGIIKNKTKFLISTNRPIDAVDDALQRPGRLFDIFSFTELTKEEAFIVWKENKLSKKSFDKEFKDAYVLQAKLGNKISEYLNNKGKANKSYLKNKNISVSDKFKKERRAGFNV